MQFSISKSDLCRVLSMVSGVVARKTTIPILSNVKLHADADTLTVTGTDLETALVVHTAAAVVEPGEITLPAKKLHDYARLLSDGDIKIKADANSWVTITAGRSRTRIAGIGADGFPELPSMPAIAFEIGAHAIARLIDRVRFAISHEESRFTLNGALMQAVDGALRMVATDGHRLTYDECACVGAEQFKVVLPTVAAVNVSKLAGSAPEDATVSVAQDDNHLFFHVGQALLISRKLTGNFPDYNRVLPKDAKIIVSVNRADLAGAIGRVAQFSDERSRCVKVTLNNGVVLSAASAEQGESAEDVSCDYSGAEMVCGFNSTYLSDFLSATSTDNIMLRINSEKEAMEMRECGDGGYRYVVMPMRV